MTATNHSARKMRRLIEGKFFKTECFLRDRLRQSVIDEQECLRLSQVTGIVDEELILGLLRAGFRAESIAALPLFPIAMIAWASGSVTEDERRAAGQAVSGRHALNHCEAIELFTCWLADRPSSRIWYLWEDFVRAGSTAVDRSEHDTTGREVWQVALRVAKASGGLFGIGAVCSAEREILNRITRVYGLA